MTITFCPWGDTPNTTFFFFCNYTFPYISIFSNIIKYTYPLIKPSFFIHRVFQYWLTFCLWLYFSMRNKSPFEFLSLIFFIWTIMNLLIIRACTQYAYNNFILPYNQLFFILFVIQIADEPAFIYGADGYTATFSLYCFQ